jgi:uncharacterized protein (TIGR03437 family)
VSILFYVRVLISEAFYVKQAFRLSCATAVLILLCGAFAFIQAQTRDPFITQITSSTAQSFAADISGNGRFVVIESRGDIATDKTDTRNNADGNREIFLFDYAQRRIFQITDTKSARVDPSKAFFDPTKPTDFSNIKVEVSNNHPTISNNGRWIAFSSNALTPSSFDGDANSAALAADSNQEIFLYFIPATTAVDLSNGADVAPAVDLAAGTFTRLTNTPQSRAPIAGTATTSPFVAFDNRDAAVNDNASVVAFVSTRNLVGTGNQDANPEIFVYSRTSGATAQLTVSSSPSLLVPIFNENPSLSGNGSVIAFISNANLAGGGSNNADNNAEVYLGSYDGTTAAVTRQVTRTALPSGVAGATINILSPGRRLSRDGNFIAFESIADLSGDNSLKSSTTVFVYNVAANSFKQVGPRPTNTSALRFPTFTDYDPATLRPATVIFASGLDFRADGTPPASTQPTGGLNPTGSTQIFAASPVDTTTPATFSLLTNTTGALNRSIQPFASNTRDRTSFTIEGVELGLGNPDGLAEAFYLLSKQGTDTTATLSFFTGASERPVVGANPTAPAVSGVAAGMLAIVRSATALAPSAQTAGTASESQRRPPLPVELNGVSVAINGAAAGLYFVSPGQINFVVPPGLPSTTGTNTLPVVINNNGTIIRSTIQVVPAQPDLFTQTNAFGSNRAVALNVTLSSTGTQEPFTVTSLDASGQVVPTVLRLFLTGVRNIRVGQANTSITVRIGTTDITGAAIIFVGPSDMPGTDQIDVRLPASLAGAGDVPVVVTVVTAGQTFTSRPADTAPHIRIN